MVHQTVENDRFGAIELLQGVRSTDAMEPSTDSHFVEPQALSTLQRRK
jgi:hypothetical protein